jgi:hypothetical protein
MHNANIPDDQELPSTGKLIKSTVIAAVVAVVLLVTVVMPAEYGIDPTGIGNLIGLKKMGEIKVSLAKEAATEEVVVEQVVVEGSIPPESALAGLVPIAIPEDTMEQSQLPVETSLPTGSRVPVLNHEMQVTLAPNEGTEIKVTMKKGHKVQYAWWTDGGKANFDVHADSKELNIDYHGYYKGSEERKKGIIIAAFDGSHGWFWRNRTPKTITITLTTNGEYSDISRM